MLNKRTELHAVIYTYKPHIFGITEIYPKNRRCNIQDAEFHISGYNLFKYRKPGSGLGVAIYVKETIPAEPVSIPGDHSNTESIWCSIKPDGARQLLVGCIYRSPSSPDVSNSELNSLIKSAANLHYDDICIMGDFNYPEIDWPAAAPPQNPDHIASRFYDVTVNECYLTQHICQPTHHRGNQRPTLIDLLFTSDADDVIQTGIDSLQHLPGLGLSHHDVILFTLSTQVSYKSKPITRVMYDDGDYNAIRSELSAIDWATIHTMDIQNAWSFIKQRLSDSVNRHIPRKTFDPSRPRRPNWMDSDVLLKVKQKRTAFRKRRESTAAHERWKKARNDAKRAVRDAKLKFERSLAEKINDNPKAFFAYANSKLKPKPGIPDLKTRDGTPVANDQAKAELLNDYFASVFTAESNNPPLPDPGHRFQASLINVDFNPEELTKKLKALNPSKSPGLDNLHPRVLGEVADVIATPLAHLFKKSFESGQLPEDWKEALVTPIFKKGSKSDPANYRPVSLTPVLCKIMESFVRDAILKFMLYNQVISEHQHGFIPKRSCSTQLLEVLESWTCSIEQEHSVDAIYLDFSKAFDTVPHQRLANKLDALGIRGNCLAWVKSFLADRRQCVKVNGMASGWKPVSSGIPQGSVLGPMLFIAFINDLPDVVSECHIKLFADDAKLYTNVDSADDAAKLQNDLNHMVEWSNTWLLRFNASKCKVMHFGRRNQHFDYSMSSQTLESSRCEKDLGVWINTELTAEDHIKTVVSKANQLMGMIKRSFTLRDAATLGTLFKSIVRPHLEYGFSVWWPNTLKQNTMIEKVLRNATRLVPTLAGLSYPERLRELGIPSMIYRRYRGDIVQVYKYLHGLYDVKNIPLNPLRTNTSNLYALRGHNLYLSKSNNTKSVRRNFFSQRVVNHWNALPSDIVNAPTLGTLKARLDRYRSAYKYSVDPPPVKPGQ